MYECLSAFPECNTTLKLIFNIGMIIERHHFKDWGTIFQRIKIFTVCFASALRLGQLECLFVTWCVFRS